MIGKKFFILLVCVIVSINFAVPQPVFGQGKEITKEAVDTGMGFGIFVNLETNSIQMIDPVTMTISDSYLKGQLGTYEGGLFDIAVTPDGKTAILNNYWDGEIFSLDISGGFGVEPKILGSQFCHLPPTELDITPDGKYVMVSSDIVPAVSVIEISSMRFVLFRFFPNCDCQVGESIAIAPDNQTVLVTDFWEGAIYVMMWDNETEDLRQVDTKWVLPFWPVNVVFSPDGKTVVVPMAYQSKAVTFTLESPGVLTNYTIVDMPGREGQSAIFTSDGSKLYMDTNDPSTTGYQVHQFDVPAPGQIAYTGCTIQLKPPRNFNGVFGIETLALDATESYLFTTNPTFPGGVGGGTDPLPGSGPSELSAYPFITVIDLGLKMQVTRLRTLGIPMGIAWVKPVNSERVTVNSEQ